MGVHGFQSDVLENFSLGVVTSVLKDRLPDGAVPFVRNGQFFNIGDNTALYGTRYGCEVENPEDPSSAKIISQYFLNTQTNDVHLVVNGDGDLQKLESANINTIDSGLITDTDAFLSWATANNLAFAVNGTDQFKTDGTDVTNFGILQPDSGDWSASAGGSAGVLPAGTYQVAIGYYNSSTDHTGPTSEPVIVTVTPGQKITVTLPNAGTINDPQVDFIKVYILQEDTMSNLLLVVAGTTPAITGTQGWAVGTATVVINSTQDEMDAFELLAPQVNENYPPPDNAQFLAEHKARMFVATDKFIYWSEVDDPESFNLVNGLLPVGEEDGESITQIAAFQDKLIIFKRNAVYELVGTDPRSWVIELVDNTIGSVAPAGVGVFDNRLFWMAIRGPQMWEGRDSNITDITTPLLRPNFDKDHIDPESLANVVIIGHIEQSYVAWAITPVTQTRNITIIPFYYKLNRWMASEWNIVDVRSCAVVNDSTGRPWPFLGDYDGYIYRLGATDADGVPAGVLTTGISTDASDDTITDDTATTWVADQLIGRYIYVWQASAGIRTAQRRRIVANSETVIQVASNWDSNPVGYNYQIGGIFFDWRSAFRNGGGSFFIKRIEFLFLEVASSSGNVTFDAEIYKNLDETNPVISRTLSLTSGALWDEATWDVDLWGGQLTSNHFRIPIRTVGYSWQTRITHMSAGEQLYIYRLGVQWLTKTKKVGRHVG